ncbi:hypothetical protein M758_UG129800 [Ceratodon purpureus]|nr:hypothetical protein M758_UG129800 [Ceratodon purpureus]
MSLDFVQFRNRVTFSIRLLLTWCKINSATTVADLLSLLRVYCLDIPPSFLVIATDDKKTI